MESHRQESFVDSGLLSVLSARLDAPMKCDILYSLLAARLMAGTSPAIRSDFAHDTFVQAIKRCGWTLRREQWLQPAFGQLLSVTLTQGMKFVVRRTRPDREARSFPSGHASAAFATAAVLHEHFGRRVAIPAYAVALYTSTSRLQANSHFPSDVIIGATLGIIVGRTATIDVARVRFEVTTVPVKGGAMVVVAAR